MAEPESPSVLSMVCCCGGRRFVVLRRLFTRPTAPAVDTCVATATPSWCKTRRFLSIFRSRACAYADFLALAPPTPPSFAVERFILKPTHPHCTDQPHSATSSQQCTRRCHSDATGVAKRCGFGDTRGVELPVTSRHLIITILTRSISLRQQKQANACFSLLL